MVGDHETLSGVGYTYPNDGVVSGEWTLGAIFAVRAMYYNLYDKCEDTYTFDPYTYDVTNHVYNVRQDFCDFVVEQLRRDETNMLATMYDEMLYAEVPDMGATNLNNGHKVNKKTFAVNYANKERYFIPFGWYAEKNPSMASTAWMLFQERGYNPMNIEAPYQPQIPSR